MNGAIFGVVLGIVLSISGTSILDNPFKFISLMIVMVFIWSVTHD